MKKMRKTALAFLAVCLTVSVFAFGSCEKEPIVHTVQVITEGGMPLSDIGVFVYADDSLENLVWASDTDGEGRISFEAAPSDKYVATLRETPAGYKTEPFYPLDGAQTTIKPSVMLRDEESLDEASFKTGDIFSDLSVTDVEGKEYRISELLSEKKAVVLNFWYLGCGPCKMEFPYLEAAYEQYSDSIEVLALNPSDDTDDEIAAFASERGLTFPMAKIGDEWVSRMDLSAYPTTVVIDRYGMISMIHKGYVTESGIFEKIFEYYVSDSYVQTTVRNVSDIE